MKIVISLWNKENIPIYALSTQECIKNMINNTFINIIPAIKQYFQDKPVLRAWLFGSVSRGEETDSSDVDILVDYDNSGGTVSLFTMGGMLMDLSDIVGRRVDLVDYKGLKKFARQSVDNDKILIYERGN